ncbi:MAG TPA: FxSxx-COOH system tetratricopeptide repeat protein [Pirellulaceae bacterium]|nr:FxSxx-COOH system tetratricopeptide repeat protein [Pirellulaceae bacterium]
MADFFISYNKADLEWAEWIAWQLEQSGRTVTIQAWDFRPGSNFVLQMQSAAATSARTIGVLSPDYLASTYTQPEWAAAFAKDPTGEKQALLFVRVRECKPEGLLPQIVYIDLVDKSETDAKRELLAGVQLTRAKPTHAPAYPGTRFQTIVGKPRFPGSLPPIWNVPYTRNPNFTGRAELLEQMRNAMVSDRTATLIQSVHGLGGIGKTQLVIEYAYRHVGEYVCVWWVRAEDAATRLSDYAALAKRLSLPEADMQDERITIDAVRLWFGQNAGWLLVLDNVPHARDVAELLPTTALGHVIVTSRDPNWGQYATPFRVDVFDCPSAVEYVLRRTGSSDRTGAAQLAMELGNLPLALAQAAAYIEQTGIAITDYLALFLERRRELWSQQQPPAGYERTVAETLSLSLDQVRKQSEAAHDLVSIFAFLGPDDIPLSLLAIGAKGIPEKWATLLTDQLVLNNSIALLRSYSLVERNGDLLSVHRLVQTVCRDRLKTDAAIHFAKVAVRLMGKVFPDGTPHDEPTLWPICSQLVGHAMIAAQHAESLAIEPEESAYLFNQVGLYLHGRQLLKEAADAHRHALRIDEAHYGPDHENVALRANNLGAVLNDLGSFSEAQEAIERALRINQQIHGPDDPLVGVHHNLLGMIKRELGDLAKASEYLERAIAISEAALGPDHIDVAISLGNLGVILRERGDLVGSHEKLTRALRIFESTFGLEHPRVAIALGHLGQTMADSGDWNSALDTFKAALQIEEKLFGAEDASVGQTANCIGRVLMALNDPNSARKYGQRALAICRKIYGDEHEFTKVVSANLRSIDGR